MKHFERTALGAIAFALVVGTLVYVLPRMALQKEALTASDVASAMPDPDVFMYAAEFRKYLADGTWTNSVEIFSFDPKTGSQQLIGYLPENEAVYGVILEHEGQLYTWDQRTQDALLKVTKEGAGPFIRYAEDRHIGDARILDDGRFLIVSFAQGPERARDSKLDLYSADGKELLQSIPISAESPFYGGVRIIGVHDAGLVYLQDGGGDAGMVKGVIYRANLSNGEVKSLGSYETGADGMITGFYPGMINPSATHAAHVERRADAPGVRIRLTPLPDGAAEEFELDLDSTTAPVQLAGWLDDEHIVLNADGRIFAVHVSNRTERTLPAAEKGVGALFLSRDRGYAFLDSAYRGGPRGVYIFDTDNFDPIRHLRFVSYFEGEPISGNEYAQYTESPLEIR